MFDTKYLRLINNLDDSSSIWACYWLCPCLWLTTGCCWCAICSMSLNNTITVYSNRFAEIYLIYPGKISKMLDRTIDTWKVSKRLEHSFLWYPLFFFISNGPNDAVLEQFQIIILCYSFTAHIFILQPMCLVWSNSI